MRALAAQPPPPRRQMQATAVPRAPTPSHQALLRPPPAAPGVGGREREGEGNMWVWGRGHEARKGPSGEEGARKGPSGEEGHVGSPPQRLEP